MVALPKQRFHLHADALAADITKRLRLPALDLRAVKFDCWRGTREDLVTAFTRIANTTRSRTVELPPTEMIINDTAQAMIFLANRLAGDSATVGELNSALLMLFELLPSALEGELGLTYPTADFLTVFHLQRQAKAVIRELRQAKDEVSFERAYAFAMEVNEQAMDKIGEPTLFRFLESTWHQAQVMRRFETALEQPTDGLHIAPILSRMLAEMSDEDSRFTRSDEEFDAIVIRAEAEASRMSAIRLKLSQALTTFIREITDQPGLDAEIKYHDGVAPDLSNWSKFHIDVVPGPFAKSFMLRFHGMDVGNEDDVMDVLATALGLPSR